MSATLVTENAGTFERTPGQVGLPGLDYLAPMGLNLIEAVAYTCRDARKARGIKQSRVAAALDADQSTIARFETGRWPTDLEATLAAYASELELSPRELFDEALAKWDVDPLSPLTDPPGRSPGLQSKPTSESPNADQHRGQAA